MRYIFILNEDYDYLELDILEPCPKYYNHVIVSKYDELNAMATINVLTFERETLLVSGSREFFHFYREVNIDKRFLDPQIVL